MTFDAHLLLNAFKTNGLWDESRLDAWLSQCMRSQSMTHEAFMLVDALVEQVDHVPSYPEGIMHTLFEMWQMSIYGYKEFKPHQIQARMPYVSLFVKACPDVVKARCRAALSTKKMDNNKLVWCTHMAISTHDPVLIKHVMDAWSHVKDTSKTLAVMLRHHFGETLVKDLHTVLSQSQWSYSEKTLLREWLAVSAATCIIPIHKDVKSHTWATEIYTAPLYKLDDSITAHLEQVPQFESYILKRNGSANYGRDLYMGLVELGSNTLHNGATKMGHLMARVLVKTYPELKNWIFGRGEQHVVATIGSLPEVKAWLVQASDKEWKYPFIALSSQWHLTDNNVYAAWNKHATEILLNFSAEFSKPGFSIFNAYLTASGPYVTESHLSALDSQCKSSHTCDAFLNALCYPLNTTTRTSIRARPEMQGILLLEAYAGFKGLRIHRRGSWSAEENPLFQRPLLQLLMQLYPECMQDWNDIQFKLLQNTTVGDALLFERVSELCGIQGQAVQVMADLEEQTLSALFLQSNRLELVSWFAALTRHVNAHEQYPLPAHMLSESGP